MAHARPNGIPVVSTQSGHARSAVSIPDRECPDLYPAEGDGADRRATRRLRRQGFNLVVSPFGALRFDPERRIPSGSSIVTLQDRQRQTGVPMGSPPTATATVVVRDDARQSFGRAIPSAERRGDQAAAGEAELDRASVRRQGLLCALCALPISTPVSLGKSQGLAAWGRTRTPTAVGRHSGGANLARIDTRLMELSFVPAAGRAAALSRGVDADTMYGPTAWMTVPVCATTPAAKSWTAVDMPTRGQRGAYVSLLELRRKMQVVLPYFPRPQGGGDVTSKC